MLAASTAIHADCVNGVLTSLHTALAGTSFLIEDVACPVNRLADMTVDLGNMFQKHGYDDASCFGHALEGNLHLVFSQVRRLTSDMMIHALSMWIKSHLQRRFSQADDQALPCTLHCCSGTKVIIQLPL